MDMSYLRRTAGRLGAALIAACMVGPVHAAPPGAQRPSPAVLRLAAAGLTLQQAARRVSRITGGRVLSASPTQVDGRPAYRVKVLMPGGRVRVVLVDARSGAILND